jgi:glycosyltransferase involved in cell wall biosynthesis
VKPRLIVVGPEPPPYHGVTVSTRLILANPLLHERFAVEHLNTSDHRPSGNIGRWDATNIFLAIRGVFDLLTSLRGRPGLVYLPLSQNTAGLLRDALFVRCAALARWQVVAHLRGGEFDDVYAAQHPLMRWWIRGMLDRLDSVAVLGESLRSLFDGLVSPERIAVVPNGTPDMQLNNGGRDREQVLFLSNLRRRKGVVQALEAALLVVREHPSARFVFVGAWEDRALEAAMRVRARPAGERIQFLPVLTGQPWQELVSTSGLLLFPPVEQEGHPRVVLEALAAGLPVVTTDMGAIPETVVDGECGFVLHNPLPETLANRVLRLLQEPELHESMSQAARRRYLEHFTQEVSDRAVAGWLTAVASGGTAASS